LLHEVIWERTADLWFWALEALAIYVRAAAKRTGESVPFIHRRIAAAVVMSGSQREVT
jgi:hypothetical protein